MKTTARRPTYTIRVMMKLEWSLALKPLSPSVQVWVERKKIFRFFSLFDKRETRHLFLVLFLAQVLLQETDEGDDDYDGDGGGGAEDEGDPRGGVKRIGVLQAELGAEGDDAEADQASSGQN